MIFYICNTNSFVTHFFPLISRTNVNLHFDNLIICNFDCHLFDFKKVAVFLKIENNYEFNNNSKIFI